MKQYNNHQAVRWIVNLSFVAADEQDGYRRDGISHAATAGDAVLEVLRNHMNETYPLKGIAVYECVVTQ